MIWSRILQLFHRNDHHVKTMCRMQHVGCYLEGQGHSMTLQQNRVWLKTLLFEVGFYNYAWQTTSLRLIPIRGALPGSDQLLFVIDCAPLKTELKIQHLSSNCITNFHFDSNILQCDIETQCWTNNETTFELFLLIYPINIF